MESKGVKLSTTMTNVEPGLSRQVLKIETL
jgi:hypothetical protein